MDKERSGNPEERVMERRDLSSKAPRGGLPVERIRSRTGRPLRGRSADFSKRRRLSSDVCDVSRDDVFSDDGGVIVHDVGGFIVVDDVASEID